MKVLTARHLAAATAVLAMGFTAACGGDAASAKDEKPEKKPTGQSAPKDDDTAADTSDTAEDGPAATAAGLDKAAVVTADLKGFNVNKPSKDALSGSGKITSDNAACQPIAGMIGTGQDPAPTATIYRQMAATDKAKIGVALFERLSSYEQKDAERTLSELRNAVGSCTGGFKTTGADGKTEYSKVEAVTVPKMGDEVVAYRLTGVLDSDEVPMLFTVVRQGSTVASLYSMNPFDPKKVELPNSVVSAQASKIKKTIG